SGIDFDFNLDTLEYTEVFDNDLFGAQPDATGVTYNIGGNETFVAWSRFVDGSFDAAGSSGGAISAAPTTEEVTPATTPEPSTLLGLIGVGLLGALTRKRK
ncbi:MAG: PEP-CTERM sorting domain-containing protein, partial [Microcystaceae cyanobacterium]